MERTFYHHDTLRMGGMLWLLHLCKQDPELMFLLNRDTGQVIWSKDPIYLVH